MDNKKKIALLALYVGAAISLTYVLAIDFFKSAVIIGFIYYAIIYFGYSVTISLTGLIYRISARLGKRMPGIFSTFLMRRLTQPQLDSLTRDYQGRRDAFIYDFLLLRMDIIMPAALVFGMIQFILIPNAIGINANLEQLQIATITSIFGISYLLYTLVQSYLYAVRWMADVPMEVTVKDEEILDMAFNQATA